MAPGGGSERSRGGRGRGRGGHEAGRGRGAGRGARGGRRGFSGSLMSLAPAADQRESAASTQGERQHDEVNGVQGQDAVAPSANGSSSSTVVAPDKPAGEAADDGEICFICAEPIKLYSVAKCNHRTCHICALRLRALYKKEECTFCKAKSEALIFTSNPDKNFLEFHAEEIPYKDDRLNVYFETQHAREETLILLHYNCPDEHCEYAASNWSDLRQHVRAEHGRVFCDLCTRHSRIFVHEHALYTSAELAKHIKDAHKHCDFCKLNLFSDEELFQHMRQRHEQCFICKRFDETRDEYHRDFAALERHFRKHHYVCEAKECQEQRFQVFESEMDFKAHQVAEHGGELTSKEKRDAMRVTANFTYHQNSAQARAANGSGGGFNLNSRGRQRNEERTEAATTSRDPLGLSVLASRSHVPGSGGPADHQSRRAMFGSQLSNGKKGKGQATKEAEEDAERASAARVERHQAYMARVSDILDSSDAKMYAFRAQVKMYHAGETSAGDLVDALRNIAVDHAKIDEIVNGLVDLLEDNDQKQDVVSAWTASQLEQKNFPTLSGGSSGGPSTVSSGCRRSYADANANLSTMQRGQVRNIKNNAAANSRSVWASVERAAEGGMAPRTVRPANNTPSGAFPSLGVSSSNAARNSHIPGSAGHTAAKAVARSTPWAGSSAATRGSGSSTPRPFSIDVAPTAQRSNQGSVRSNAAAFPALPSNAAAAQLAAQKRSLFEHKKNGDKPGSGSASGSHTPTTWRPADFGRVDVPGLDDGNVFNVEALAGRLHETATMQAAAPAMPGSAGSTPGGGKSKKNKQKQVLVSLGGVHRGG